MGASKVGSSLSAGTRFWFIFLRSSEIWCVYEEKYRSSAMIQDEEENFGIEPIELTLKKFFDSLMQETEPMEMVAELEMPQELCIPDDDVHIVENFESITEQPECAHMEETTGVPLLNADITDFPLLVQFMKDTETTEDIEEGGIPIEDVLRMFFDSLLQD